MKVFLGNAPWSRPGYYGVRAGSRWPHFECAQTSHYMPFPFFLAYATAVLERAGVEVLLVDGIAERSSEREFLRRVESFGPDLVVLELSTPSLKTDLHVARSLRELLGDRAGIAFCGLHDFREPGRFLQEVPAVDYLLHGEYEYTLRELVHALTKKQELAEVAGLSCRDHQGQGRKNSPRGLIEDLDELPWPARHFLPMEAYRDEPGGIPAPSVQLWSSRGCPYGCSFCAWPQLMYGGSRYRVRKPERVVDELEWLVREAGFRSFYLDDDTTNLGNRRMMKLAEELRRRELHHTPWAMMARADTSDRDTYAALREAGLHSVKFGVESADQEIVNRCGKALELARVRETVRFVKQLGIKVHLTFGFGLPGETRESAHRTIEFALQCDPDSIQFSIFTPFAGSRFHDELARAGQLTTEDTDLYDGYSTAVIRTEHMTAGEIMEAHRQAVEAWEEHLRRCRLRSHPLSRDWLQRLPRAACHPVRTARRAWSFLRTPRNRRMNRDE